MEIENYWGTNVSTSKSSAIKLRRGDVERCRFLNGYFVTRYSLNFGGLCWNYFSQRAARIILICLSAKPSSHAAPYGLLSGLRPSSLTAARQTRTFSSPLLEKRIILLCLHLDFVQFSPSVGRPHIHYFSPQLCRICTLS